MALSLIGVESLDMDEPLMDAGLAPCFDDGWVHPGFDRMGNDRLIGCQNGPDSF